MIYFILCSLCGWTFLRLFQKETLHIVNAFSALPVGIVIWNILVLIILISSLKDVIYISLFIYVFITGILLIYSFKMNYPTIKEIIWFFSVVLIQFFIILYNNYSTTIGDSAYLIIMGVDIAVFGNLPTDTGEDLLWAYPLFLPLYQATISKLFALNKFINIAPVISISLGGLLARLIYIELKRFALLNNHKVIISILLVFMFFSSHNMLIQIFYFNHHLFVAFVILLWIAFYIQWKKNKINSPYLLFLLLSIGLTFMRMEGFVLSMVLLTITLKEASFKTRKYCALSYGIFVSIYCLFLFVKGDSIYCNLSMLNNKKIFVMALMIFLYLFYNLLFDKIKFLKKINELILVKSIYLTFTLIIIIQLFTKFRERFIDSSIALLSNLFGVTGFWGLTWYVILFCFIFIFYKRGKNVFSNPVFITIVLISTSYLGMLFFRKAYRIGFGDSFNRGIIVHLLPLFVLFIVSELKVKE